MDLEPIDPVDYSYIFPSASDEALQLLQQMLTFSRHDGDVRGRSEKTDFCEEGIAFTLFFKHQEGGEGSGNDGQMSCRS